MAGGYKFAPLNVRAVYQNDGSAKATFLAEVARMTNDAGKMFKDFSNEARTQLDAALAVKRNNTGSLDLGVDELRSAAAAQQARATAAREVAAATALAAKEEGDYSQKARLAIAATQALAIEEEKAAATARAHAQAAEQVQERLNRQASATDLVVAATRRGTTEGANVINGIRAQRAAYGQLGQQLQDVVVQTQMGTSATVIFTQQVPQMAFALSGLADSANKTQARIGQVASFLAGPWGAAIFAATAVLGPFILQMLKSTDAAQENAKALGAVTMASNGLSGAQSVLGDMFDLATGKIKAQNEMLRLNATLMAIKLRAEASAEKANAQTTMNKFAQGSVGLSLPQKAAGALGVPVGSSMARESTVRQLVQEFRAGRVSPIDAVKRAEGLDFTGLAISKADFMQAISDGVSAPGKESIADKIEKSLSSGALDPVFKQPKAGKKGADPTKEAERAARAAQRLAEYGEDAGKKIANIRDSFRDIPPEVERVNKASRELDDIISDLMNRKPEGFAELVKQAESLKTALPDMSFGRVMRQITEDAQQQVAVQSLILQGREGEADALRQIYQIEQQLGPLRADQKQDIIDTSVAMQRVNEAMQRAQEIQSVFLDSTRAVRGEVEAILGGYGKLSDLGATLKRSFQQIQGKVLTEQIFGDLFRDMDRYVKDKTGIGSSVDMMAKETVRAGEAAGTLADEMIAAAQRIAGAGSSATSAAAIGSSAISGGWSNIGIPPLLKAPANENYDPNAPIVVEAKKPGGTRTVNDLRPEEYFHKFGQAFGGKFAAILEPLLGKKLAGNLGGVLGGVLEGQATTGTGFGAILGGLKELKGLPEGLTKGLGKAFSGAQTGAAVAGIGNALGLKMSNEGAQIGGALGSFLGPAGSIIGALGGGFLGKLFGGTKKGYAVASNGSVSTGGNSKQAEAAGTSASALNESLGSIAKAFGSSLGNYAVSIGSRSSGYISVSASGSSSVADKGYKKGQIGKDIIYDGKDMEEALRVALQNAIQDGAIAGIKAGSKRLLSLGSNIDAQVEKALKFEGVFKSLRAIKDPMGAALDELNTEFKNLIDIFKEAGASTTEFGQLEELYGIQRKEAIEQVTQAMTSSLKALKEELTIGSDYFSLRDRKASALEVYNPLKQRVEAGDTTAFDAFSDAARNLISIEREISGSTSPFFALLQEVTNLSNNALNRQNASISATTASDSPFAALAAQNAATASAIDSQTEALLAGLGGRLDLLNANLIAALRGQTTQATQATQATFDVSQFYANKRFW